jgi:hypothetical protein
LRPSGNTPLANSTHKGITPLLTGIDGLYVGYYGDVRKSLLNMVVEDVGSLRIDGMDFIVKTEPRGPYRATLDNEMLNLALDNRAHSPFSPSVYAQVKSAFIWSEGLDRAYQKVLNLMSRIFIDCPGDEKLSRVDIFADFLWSKPFRPQDIEKFVGRARKSTTHSEDQRISGFSIGKGDIRARIYDKTLEARQVGKGWLLELWGRDGDLEVWRVEFQLRREALKSFGIERLDDFLNASQSIWDYCTNQWLSMRGNAGKKTTRRKATTFWRQVQATKFDLQAEAPRVATRSYVRSGMNEEQAAAQIAGAAKSFARYRQMESSSKALDLLLPRVRLRLNQTAAGR